MTKRNRTAAHLTELQQAILDYVWKHGDVTSEQVREGVKSKHPLKDSSIRTLLRRLEARGYLRHRVEGKAFIYAATERQHSLAARTVRQIIDRFCAGSVEQFLVGMVDERVLTLEEIERLAKKVRKQR